MATTSRRINGKPVIHRKPAGAKRGRKATGRTTSPVSMRLSAPQATELKRRAEGAGISQSEFAKRAVVRELGPHGKPKRKRTK